jgi:NADP-dependent 3-hydroxy acid dehydrogenase YdfG
VTDASPPPILSGPEPDPAGLFSVADRVAVVTGASSGLGVRFAVLHAAGAKVVVSARRADRLEQLIAVLARSQCRATWP